MIKFSKPPYRPMSLKYIEDAVKNEHICGDGKYTRMCSEWIEERTLITKSLFTTSCTHALEMAAFLLDIKPGDEVILPSYTFASTADAFAMRGAKLVFVDIRPDTMNIDERLIETAITSKTRAIVPVHYAGVACEMDRIMEIADNYQLAVVEDAAQAMMASYKGQSLGTFGDFGCFSFHETKNYSMGEGGAILLKKPEFIELAEILREKGTNRSKFWRGEIDKYTWVGLGSSYLPSELNMAYLWSQLEFADEINEKRIDIWNQYHQGLGMLCKQGFIEQPSIPKDCKHNAHMYYIKVKDEKERCALIQYLKEKGIQATFHYIPLHTAPSGKKYGVFKGSDVYTTRESERILRLPIYNGLQSVEIERVIDEINKFYGC